MSRNDLPSPGAANFSQRLREAVMTYLGRQGDPLDRGITLRDLIDSGLVRLRQGYTVGQAVGGGGTLPLVPEVQQDTPDLTPPPTPTGFAVSAAISHVFVEHDNPTYTQGHGHLRTRVYGKIVQQGDPLPTFADAAEIAQFTGRIYAHPSNPATTWRLWIKWESADGVLSASPAGGTNGLQAVTGQDVSTLLEALTGEITQSQLYQALSDRIDLIDGTAALSGSVNARIATVNDIAVVKNRTYISASAPTSPPMTLVAGDLWIDSDDANKLYRWTGTAWASVTDTRIGSLVTDFQSEVTQRIDGDLAETRRREALYAGSFAGSGNNYRYFVQATQPTGTQIGDIWSWVDPASGAVTFRRFNGSTWVDSSADKRAAVYKGASSSPPTTSLVIGDLYLDLDDNKVYVYNGSGWVLRQATMPEVAAFVYSEQVARVDGDSAIAQQVSTVSATKTRSYWQASPPAGTAQLPLVEGDLWFDTDDANRVYRWSGSQWQSGRDGAIAIVDARVDTVETAKIGYCTLSGEATNHTTRQLCEAAGGTWNVGLPIATAVKQVAISDGLSTAALEQRFTAQRTTNDGLLAQYTLKVDVGGHVSGFGLASTSAGATPQSDFGVRADRFWVTPPTVSSASAPSTGLYKGYVWRDTGVSPAVTRYWTGSAWSTAAQTVPFVVVTSSGTINGVTVGPGVYIDTAFVADATITRAKIALASIDSARIAEATIVDANIASLNADKITAGTLNANRIAANSITASKIDSRGLTIKDAAGNIIFGADDNLNWSRIAGQPGGIYNSNISINANGQLVGAGGGQVTLGGLGAGALATQSNVFVGSTVRFADGTVMNTEDFVNKLSLITSANVSTFIAAAAIGDAYIGNLNAAKINAGTLSADRIGAGSITASKIDSRGLSIQDATGNIILAAGTPLSGGYLAAGTGVNVIPNSDFIDGAGTLAAWSHTTATPPAIGVNLSSDYQVAGEGTAWAAASGSPTAGLAFYVGVKNGPSDFFSCIAGQRYEFSAYLKTLNASATISLVWFTAAGSQISEVFSPSVNSTGTFTSLAGMVRSSAFAVAPAGAVSARVSVVAVCNGGATPGFFASRVYFGAAGSVQSEASPWTPGRGVGRITVQNASTYIADLAVDTLQIAGSAITVPIISEYAPQVGIAQNTWTQLLSVSPNFGSVTPRGALISAQAVIYITSGAQNSWSFRIKRGGTQIKQYDFTVANNVSPIAIPIQFIDETPGTGTVTYTFEAWHDTNATGGVQNTSLVVYGGKR